MIMAEFANEVGIKLDGQWHTMASMAFETAEELAVCFEEIAAEIRRASLRQEIEGYLVSLPERARPRFTTDSNGVTTDDWKPLSG